MKQMNLGESGFERKTERTRKCEFWTMAGNRDEISLKTDFATLKLPLSETECINSHCSGCCADLP